MAAGDRSLRSRLSLSHCRSPIVFLRSSVARLTTYARR